jgi:SAM-dependent MidA family methyltransferase
MNDVVDILIKGVDKQLRDSFKEATNGSGQLMKDVLQSFMRSYVNLYNSLTEDARAVLNIYTLTRLAQEQPQKLLELYAEFSNLNNQ